MHKLSWIAARLTLNLSDIHGVHFSGQHELCDQQNLNGRVDHQFINDYLVRCQPWQAQLRIDRKGNEECCAEFDVVKTLHTCMASGRRGGNHDAHRGKCHVTRQPKPTGKIAVEFLS